MESSVQSTRCSVQNTLPRPEQVPATPRVQDRDAAVELAEEGVRSAIRRVVQENVSLEDFSYREARGKLCSLEQRVLGNSKTKLLRTV